MFSLKFISATKEYSTLEKRVPAPYLRKSFCWNGGSAAVTICGLGFYELYINGKNVTKGPLAPYISNPDDILYYDRYDVTAHLVPGENVIGVVLGNGMLNCPGGQIWDFDQARYRSAPKVALAFESENLTFEADDSFRCAPSPIDYDDLRVGEFYDARREIPGWDLPGFDDSAWTPAIPAETPRGECRICEAEPIIVSREIAPVSIIRGKIGPTPDFRPNLPVIEPAPDAESDTEGWLYDFGVNTAGVPRLKVVGRPGQKIVIQLCEKLMDDTSDTLDLRAMTFLPKALNHRMIYICKGGEEEIHVPRFTYYGFRYALVLGLDDAQATPELLTLLVMHSDLKVRTTFHSDNEVLNKIFECTLVSNFSNFFYFPTDCPHREKNGWTGDAQLSAEQMLITMTPENSYREWLRNIRKAQREDGALPGIVPTCGWGFDWGNGPAWDAALTVIPYYVWKYRGDTEIIRENAAAILRYLHYIMTRRDEKGLIHIGLGDWCHANRSEPLAPLEVTDTLICMDIAAKASEMYAAIGMDPESVYANAVFDALRAAGRRHLIDFSTMVVLGRCQTSQAMALHYNFFDEPEKSAAFDVLLQLIEENDRLMDVGILGNRVLFDVLSAFGRSDLAYELILTPRFPSYANWIARGATSLWETFKPHGAPADSLNHHMWADITRWLCQRH